MTVVSLPRLLSLAFAIFLLFGSTACSFAFQPQGLAHARHARPCPSLASPAGSIATSSSKTQRQVWSQALAVIDTFYHTAPYAAGALTCGAKASAADFVAQKRQPSFHKFEIARNVAFLVYGAVYQGVAQEYLYNQCYAAWFGSSNQPIVVLKKVLFDLCVQTTLVTLPVAYLTKAIIFRYSLCEGLRRYKHDVLHSGLLKKYFTLWGPVQCLTFSVVPEHLRISFVAAVSFFWLIILSTISGKQEAIEFIEEPLDTQDLLTLVNGTAVVA